MKALPKTLKKQHAELVERINTARQAVDAAIQDYNDALDEAEAFCTDEVAAAIQEWMDERSEKWQESEAASEVESWKSEWEDVDLERLEIEFEGEDTFSQLPLTRE